MLKEGGTLILEVFKQNETLKMSAFEQEALASTIRHYSSIPVSFPQIEKLCHEIVLILNKTDKKGILEPYSFLRLKKTGQMLWDHLFTKSIKDKLRSSSGCGLILSLDEELISIPWELLYDGQDFLCLKFSLGRLVRTDQQAGAMPNYRSSENTLKMLVLANPTNDLKAAYLEGIEIKNQFDRKKSQVSVDFKSTHIDTLYVKKNLRDYDIVHFAGHCEYDERHAKKSGWLLNDGRFTVQDIISMGESFPLPGLVFSNACYSAKTAESLMHLDYQAKTYNLASAFLFSGVRHYIGTIRKVEDSVSSSFAREFYAFLIRGKTVGEALRQARLVLAAKYGANAVSWANYLLYGDANFVLFKPKHKAAKVEKNKVYLKKMFIGISFLGITLLLGIFLYTRLPGYSPKDYYLVNKARSFLRAGKNQESLETLQQVLQKAPGYLGAYPLLGESYQRQGKRSQALQCYFEYALNSEKRSDKKNLAAAYINIGWVYYLLGQYPKALDFYNQAFAVARENRDFIQEAVASRKLAVWYIDQGDYDRALEFLTKSSAINYERQYIPECRYNLACDYFDIGLVFANKDDYKSAREFYHKSQLLFEKMRLKNELSDCYFNAGEMYLFEKKYQKALVYYSQGIEIDKRLSNLPSLACDYEMMGDLYWEMGKSDKAEEYYLKAIAICQKIEAPLELASASFSLGKLYKQKEWFNKAREYFRTAQEVYRRLNHPGYQEVRAELMNLT